MIFRLLFILLVFANLLFFAWSRGYLGGMDETREPQRLAQQLNADKLRIVRDAPQAQEKSACTIINGLTATAAEALEQVVSTAGGGSKRLPQMETHRLLIPALADKAAVDKKLAELRQLGVNDGNAVTLPDGRHEIVLAVFDNEAAARAALAALTKQGVKSVQWEKPKPPIPLVLEIQAPPAVLTSHLAEWIAPYPMAKVSECAR